MKILLINDFSRMLGGAENYFYNLLNLLESKGHDVKTFFSEEKPKLRPVRSIFSLKSLRDSYRIIKEFKPDIVHIHKYNLSLSPSPAISSKMLGIRTIVTFHDFGQLCANQWCVDKDGRPCRNPSGIEWVFRRSLSRKNMLIKAYNFLKNKVHLAILKNCSDAVIGPSESMCSYLAGIFPPRKVFHIPYFISDSWEYKSKKKMGNRLLFIGRLEKEKGIGYLLEAMRYTKKDVTLDIIGGGSERSSISKKIRDLGLCKRVNMVGEVKNKRIQGYYHRSDALVMPSVWMEQFGIAGLEAMACGLPVIASNIGGVSDWLIDGKNGYRVNSRNPESIASAINSLLSDIKRVKEFSSKGIKIVNRKYKGSLHYSRLMKLYLNHDSS